MNYYLSVLKKYTVFTGRAGRAEYWYFVLFNIIVMIILNMISSIVGDKTGALSGIYSLAVLLPNIGVGIRRMHDIGKSGWWILISLIPIIGWIWFLILAIKDGTPGDNMYGPNPKGAAPMATTSTMPTPPTTV